MKRFFLILTLITFHYSHSQNNLQIAKLEAKKKQLELEIQQAHESIKAIDIAIVELKSKVYLERLNDSSLIAIARKGAKLKKVAGIYGDIVETLEADREVIVLDYRNGYFQICYNSLCGYMSEIWITKTKEIKEFITLKETSERLVANVKPKEPIPTHLTKSSSANKSTGIIKSYGATRTYYRGPRGGCYYINSNGNKSYVDRSLCN